MKKAIFTILAVIGALAMTAAVFYWLCQIHWSVALFITGSIILLISSNVPDEEE